MHHDFSEEAVQAQLPLWDNTEQLIYSMDDFTKMTGVTARSFFFSY